MNTRGAMIFVLMGMAALLAGCTGGKYGDVVEVNTQFVDAMDKYVDAAGKASSGKEMARAISDYADRMDKLAPKMKEVRVKYPGLFESPDLPEKLKALEKRASELEQKIVASHMNMIKYLMDPEVQAAQQRLQDAMMKMQ